MTGLWSSLLIRTLVLWNYWLVCGSWCVLAKGFPKLNSLRGVFWLCFFPTPPPPPSNSEPWWGVPFNFVVSPPDVNSALLLGPAPSRPGAGLGVGVGGTAWPLSPLGAAPLAVDCVRVGLPLVHLAWFTGTSSCSYRGKSGINTFLALNVVPYNTLHPF